MKSFGPPSNNPKGRDYSTALRGLLLTDAVIDRYARLGYYGEAARRAAVEAIAKKPRGAKKQSNLKRFLSLLDV